MTTVRTLLAVGAVAAIVLVLTLVTVVVAAADRWPWWLVLLAIAVVAVLVAARLRKWIRRGTVLEIDLDGGVVETTGANPVARALNRKAVAVRDVVDALHGAADDPRISGLVVRLGNGAVDVAHAQELRDAVAHFRGAGKTTIAFAEVFGESRDATVDYYLAAAFERIHLQPIGGVSLQGRLARTPFLRTALDKLGIQPDLDHREEYKTAKYLLTETALTEPHREALGDVVGDQLDQMVAGIAADRGVDADEVRRLVDRAPLDPSEALEAGLVDVLGHRDGAWEAAGSRYLFHDRYLKKAGRPHRKGDRIALVHATGSIQRGSSGFDPLTRGPSMGADDVAGAMRKARDDDKVKAIVLRIDSPGGSAVASEVIRREVVRARASDKPVVVSMGNLAGSGGYWIAMDADRIIAQPGTITGSIGVVDGKFVTRDAWARIGVTFDQLGIGDHAGYFSGHAPYSDGERTRMQARLDEMYDRFTTLVAKGRNLEVARVREIAKGRIWSGATALDHGLVDELGGLETAITRARELAGIPAGRPVKVTVFPKQRPLPIPTPDESSEPVELAIAMVVDLVAMTRQGLTGVQARIPGI